MLSMLRIATILFTGVVAAAHATTDVRQLMQTADYIGVDYANSVRDGQVVDAAEYAEMEEFSAMLASGMAQLPPTTGRETLQAAATALSAAVESKAPAATITDLTRRISLTLNRWYPVVNVPEQAPSLELGAKLYQAQCAGCHGVEGRGDGAAGLALEPRPTDFQDNDRARQRSLFGLYNTIGLGVSGTAMTAFSSLSEHERWSLAFYVASLQADTSDQRAFAKVASDAGAETMLTASADSLRAAYAQDGEAALAWLRDHPADLSDLVDADVETENGLGVALRQLRASRAAWQAADVTQAERLALSAYLDGVELVEAALRNVDSPLARETELAMGQVRTALREGEPTRIEEAFAVATELLRRSELALESGTLAGGIAFASAFVILAREGLEAILLVAAMLVVVRRTDAPPSVRTNALRALHGGWILALVAGLATWMISSWVLVISGAVRELTEGITALLAAAVLLWVGLWMHGQAASRTWSHFVGEGVGRAVAQRSAWVLLGLSFLSVYREVFETILFYQALWLQVDAGAEPLVLAGMGAAVLALAGLTWLILRAGQRLPIGTFFTVCAYSVLVLAVIFTGKGVAALQEAGQLPLNTLDLPAVEILGFYPSTQGLAFQLFVAVLAVWWLWRQHGAASAGT